MQWKTPRGRGSKSSTYKYAIRPSWPRTNQGTNTSTSMVKSPKRIVLIDGEELARLMVVHEIGVRPRIRYAVNRIDEDYFDGEDL